jgi:hypothetical protein
MRVIADRLPSPNSQESKIVLDRFLYDPPETIRALSDLTGGNALIAPPFSSVVVQEIRAHVSLLKTTTTLIFLWMVLAPMRSGAPNGHEGSRSPDSMQGVYGTWPSAITRPVQHSKRRIRPYPPLRPMSGKFALRASIPFQPHDPAVEIAVSNEEETITR